MNEQVNNAPAQAPVNGAKVELTKRPVEVPQTTEAPKGTDANKSGAAPVKA